MRFAALALAIVTGASACSTDPAFVRGGGSSGASSGEEPDDPDGPDARATTRDGGSSSGGDSGEVPGELETKGFPAKWIDGTACATEGNVQEWTYAAGTHILRQSLCTNFEGPFVYLLVGSKKALLVDTGTGAVNLRPNVVSLLGSAAANIDLVVAHSHGHGDHVGGDNAFKNQARTTVVGTQTASVRQFFGITDTAASTFDLGDRIVDVIPIPGHQAAHVAFYDRKTKLLLTGDTLYPGRLYIDDWTAYRASIPRLVAFVDAGHPVSWVLGAHIELPKTGADYAGGVKQHPNEHVLELTDKELRDLDGVVKAQGATPKRQVSTHFILSP